MKNLVLITRPEVSAASTADALNKKGYQTFCEAFLNVVYDETDLPDLSKYSALIFTSANAVRAFITKSERRDIPVYCVGAQTLAALQKEGFKGCKSAQGKVSDLIEMLENEDIDGKILYCRARDIAHPLLVSGKDIKELILYHTEKSQEISKNCLNLMERAAFTHVLFYSVRTAEAFAALVEKHGVQNGLNQCTALCLGDSMIKCIESLQWKQIKVAKTPDHNGMLELLERSQ